MTLLTGDAERSLFPRDSSTLRGITFSYCSTWASSSSGPLETPRKFKGGKFRIHLCFELTTFATIIFLMSESRGSSAQEGASQASSGAKCLSAVPGASHMVPEQSQQPLLPPPRLAESQFLRQHISGCR